MRRTAVAFPADDERICGYCGQLKKLRDFCSLMEMPAAFRGAVPCRDCWSRTIARINRSVPTR